MTRSDLKSAMMNPQFSLSEKVMMARVLDNWSTFQNQHLEDVDSSYTPGLDTARYFNAVVEPITREDVVALTQRLSRGNSSELKNVLNNSERTLAHIKIIDKAGQRPSSPSVQEWGDDGINAMKFYILNKMELTDFKIFDFKEQWVQGYSESIKQAAKEFDLPEMLIAGMSFNEVGGQFETLSDRAIYEARDIAEHLPDSVMNKIPARIKSKLESPKQNTSFGNTSIQIANVAEDLGYDIKNLTNTQQEMIIESLQDSRQSIFMAANHLRTLANRNYPGVPASKMGDQHIKVLGARYNMGNAGLSRAQVEGYIKQVEQLIANRKPIPKELGGFTYGVDMLRHSERLQRALQ